MKLRLGLSVSTALFASIILVVSCGRTGNRTNLNDLKWLEGTWFEMDHAGFRETWQWQNDQMITGFGFTTENDDTLVSEKLQIFVKNTDIFYQSLVFGHNHNQEIGFRLTYKTADSLVFNNPDHDFPKYIIYRKLGSDSLRVYVRDGFGDGSKGFELTLLRQ